MTKGRPFQELAINSSTVLFQKESFSISSEVLTLHLVTERSLHFFALSEVLPVACGNKLVNGWLDMVPPAGTSVAQAPNGQQEAPAQQGFFGGGVGSIFANASYILDDQAILRWRRRSSKECCPHRLLLAKVQSLRVS